MTALHAGLIALGLPMPQTASAIVSLAPKSAEASDAVQRGLLSRRLFVPLMSYGSGPGTEFLRIAVSAAHTQTDIASLLEVLAEAGVANHFELLGS
jgi:7-keto-8-aminopelargonate synthetase-like enzyme